MLAPQTRRAFAAAAVCTSLLATTACAAGASGTGRLDVEAGQDVRLTSDNDQVRITIPGDSLDGRGTLEVASREDGSYDIDLSDGAKLTGDAQLAFKVPNRSDAPVPLVTYAEAAGDTRQPFEGASLKGGYARVTTNHFSNWFVTWWQDVLQNARNGMDRIYSGDAQAKAPSCSEESTVRDDGYDITSDDGSRVMWCLGLEEGRTVLKVVNARGYAVVVEHTPNAERLSGGPNDLSSTVADLIPVAPSKKGNKTFIIGAGDSATFAVPATGATGVRLYPDPGAYLVTALLYGAETYAQVLKASGSDKSTDAIIKGYDITSCAAGYIENATGSIQNVAEAVRYLESAMETAIGCAELVVDDLDLGFFAGPVREGLVWLVSGIRTALNGFGAAADSLLNWAGYRIAAVGPEEATPTYSSNPIEWPAGPGHIGPVRADARIDTLLDNDWAARSNDGICDLKWQLSDRLYPLGWFADFRADDPDQIDGIAVGKTTLDGSPSAKYSTAEGIGIGTSTTKLKATYADLEYGVWPIEGGPFVGYVRSTPEGSIMFDVGTTDPNIGTLGGDGTKVVSIVVTGATNTSDFYPPVGGC